MGSAWSYPAGDRPKHGAYLENPEGGTRRDCTAAFGLSHIRLRREPQLSSPQACKPATAATPVAESAGHGVSDGGSVCAAGSEAAPGEARAQHQHPSVPDEAVTATRSSITARSRVGISYGYSALNLRPVMAPLCFPGNPTCKT
jgi:hypothetical protein